MKKVMTATEIMEMILIAIRFVILIMWMKLFQMKRLLQQKCNN